MGLSKRESKRFGGSGIWRYKDEQGLWRRYVIDCLDSKGNAKKGWGSDGEVHGAGNEQHFISSNGTTVFMFPREEVKA
jgi:hypothetical protein